jgi:hypothetical protein
MKMMMKQKKKRGGVPRILYGGTNVPDFTHKLYYNQPGLSRSLQTRDLSAIRHACAYISQPYHIIPINTSLPHTHTQTNQPVCPLIIILLILPCLLLFDFSLA